MKSHAGHPDQAYEQRYLAGRSSLLGNIATLLQTGEFSDLTLVCQGQEYLVHKAVICLRSPVLAAAVKKDFLEARSGRITVNVTESVTLRQALVYLYTGRIQDDDWFPFDYISNAARDAGNIPDKDAGPIARKNYDEFQTVLKDGGLHLNSVDEDHKPDCSHTGDRCICQNESSDTQCTNTRARANALLWILADYYQIFDLKNEAARSFAAAMTMHCPRDLAAVCLLVYDSAPSTALDLRMALSRALSDHSHRLVQQQAFMDSIVGLPELYRDLFVETARLSRVISDEKQYVIDAMRRAVSAKPSAHLSKSDAKAEMKDIIEAMNQAECCIRCGLDTNFHFQHESLPLRCRCLTKY